MKVLFLYPNVNKKQYSQTYHFGIGQMSSLLKKEGHETAMEYVYDLNPDKISRMISLHKPDMIGITTVSSQMPYVKTISKIIRSQDGPFTVVGGIHPTLKPECIDEMVADAIVRGEGEHAIIDLANKLEEGKPVDKVKNVWLRKNGRIIRNPIRSLLTEKQIDELPFPDRDIFNYQNFINAHERANFMFARGCPFRCTYCSNHAIANLYPTGNYLRHRSPRNSIDEILDVMKNYKNVNFIAVGNDSFNANKKWMFEFLELYKKEVPLPFKVLLRPNLADRKTFEKLKEAGCQKVFMGVESGSDYIRNDIMKRNMTTRQIKDAFRWAHEQGLKTLASNIIGLPYETEEQIMETIRLNAEIDPNFIGLGIFYPYEGTELGRLAEEKGWVRDVDFHDFVEREDSVLDMPQIKRERLVWYFNNFHYLVYKHQDPKKAMYFKLINYKAVWKGIELAKKFLPTSATRKLKKLVGGVDY